MKIMIDVTKLQEVDLSDEACDNILIQTLHDDWYNHLQGSVSEVEAAAFNIVYNFYSGKTLG